MTKDCLILRTQRKIADHEFQRKLRLQLTRLSRQIHIVRDKFLERILPEEGAGTFFHGTILNILGVVDLPSSIKAFLWKILFRAQPFKCGEDLMQKLMNNYAIILE